LTRKVGVLCVFRAPLHWGLKNKKATELQFFLMQIVDLMGSSATTIISVI
jgi:hypothetical protein